MKIKIIITGMLIFIFSSCSEDFLNLQSTSSFIGADYFKTETDFTLAVNGIYASVREWYNGGECPNPVLIGDLHSDNARYNDNPSYQAEASIVVEDVADFADVPYMFSGHWGTFYTWIVRANSIINTIDDADFDQTAKDNLKGQALYFRAFGYFWLVRLYDQAVLHLTVPQTLEETSKPISSHAEVVTQIITDATAAADLLLPKSLQEAGRVTSGTANMLLADLYAWEGASWSNVETYSRAVMADGYSLVQPSSELTAYANVFSTINKNNSESIFEIQFTQTDQQLSSRYVYRMFPVPFSVITLKELTGVSDATQDISGGQGYCIPTIEIMNAYEAGDERYDASIRDMLLADNVTTMPMCVKYLHKHDLNNRSDDNFPVYRYAETLLFLAEALNEQGASVDSVQKYLNMVRNRAGLANTTAANQADLRAAILQERRIELAFEGKRWFDLVRTNNVETFIVPYGANVIANPVDYYFKPGTAITGTAFENFQTVFDLPTDETLYNPYINQ